MNEKNKKWTLVALFLGLLEILFIVIPMAI